MQARGPVLTIIVNVIDSVGHPGLVMSFELIDTTIFDFEFSSWGKARLKSDLKKAFRDQIR